MQDVIHERMSLIFEVCVAFVYIENVLIKYGFVPPLNGILRGELRA